VFWHETINLLTQEGPQFIDITDMVAGIVSRSQVAVGTAIVFSRHTTAAIVINENEPLLLQDMCDVLTRMSEPGQHYRHDDFSVRVVNMTPDEFPNGHSHCQHLLLNTSEVIPIEAGQMALGHWQRIFFVELDRARQRQALVQVYGLSGGE
jgi:secondary thiamine-phosphate synthase enzyme